MDLLQKLLANQVLVVALELDTDTLEHLLDLDTQ